MRIRRSIAAVVALGLVVASALSLTGSTAAAGYVLSPTRTSFSYSAGPFTNANVGGLLLDACDVPQGCHQQTFEVQVPDSHYRKLRASGRVGAVQISLAWSDNDDDYDLALLDHRGDPVATSGFGNSTFERIVFTELPAGRYTIQSTVFRVVNAPVSVEARLLAMTPAKTAAAGGPRDLAFSQGTPVTLERSSGEPNMEIAPNGDIYVDIPLGAGTNSVLYKSLDNGQTFRPIAPLHPNNNPLTNNAAGGGDSGLAIDRTGRMCFSELNTLLSLGIGCSVDAGRTWTVADPLIIDPATPLVDRQWQTATWQGEQFIAAMFGLVTAGPSQPGIRAYKEVAQTGQFVKVADVDTGEAMKSYNMASDWSDRDANGGTIAQAYLRPNKGRTAKTAPHQLMIWRSTNGGTTVKTHKVADLPGSPGNNFASLAIDRQGNMYVAWTEPGTWDVFYSVAPKNNPDKWSKPVRVNEEYPTRTAIQPTIKVGDRGRVFIGYYAAEQFGNPDKLTGGVWHAYLSMSRDGACMIDSRPCKAPFFSQVRVTEHPVQHRGICLGGTGCGGDPYYGDRSMLEYLDVEFTPKTGQAHVVVTDSSRSQGNTTITIYHQTSGPSAFLGKKAIRSTPFRLSPSALVADRTGDALWPYETTAVGAPIPGMDISAIGVSWPNSSTMRVSMRVEDPTEEGFEEALTRSFANELMIGVRFATDLDVLWAGLVYNSATGMLPKVGHLRNGFLVDTYTADSAVTPRMQINGKTVMIDFPLSALKTTLQVPEGRTAPKVQAIRHGQQLYAVTGFAFSSPTTVSDPSVAKRLFDVTPAYTLRKR